MAVGAHDQHAEPFFLDQLAQFGFRLAVQDPRVGFDAGGLEQRPLASSSPLRVSAVSLPTVTTVTDSPTNSGLRAM